ncbi:MAG: ATP-dependent DNA helicase RecG, partial [Flavobacteriales bacterium]
MDVMHTAIEYLKGVGPERSRLLKEELNIQTYQDLLHFFPNRYIDRSKFYPINQLPNTSAEFQIKGIVTSIDFIKQKRGKRMVANFQDETGNMQLVWFRGYQWIKEGLKINQPYVIFGRINWFNGQASMPHPEMELESVFKQGLKAVFYPIYRSTEKLINKGVSQRVVQKLVANLIEKEPDLSETLPPYLLNHFKLISKKEALHQVHYPDNQNTLARAQARLKFEEFFYMQLQLILKNHQRKQKIKGHSFAEVGPVFKDFFKNYLPFTLTGAQKRVIKEIRTDLGSGRQMNRLLQGDVGSGKTIVALLSMLIAIDNDFQASLVAPTEILAQQHFQSLSTLLKGTDVQCALLTGSSTKKERIVIHEELEKGSLAILIGTHAIFEEKVQFKNLGLAIIDEQHRFGVAQRSKLWHKNKIPPHVLVMTATPIPRTLA